MPAAEPPATMRTPRPSPGSMTAGSAVRATSPPTGGSQRDRGDLPRGPRGGPQQPRVRRARRHLGGAAGHTPVHRPGLRSPRAAACPRERAGGMPGRPHRLRGQRPDGGQPHPRPAGVPAGIAAVRADLTDPAAVLGEPGLRQVIDLAEPVCLSLGLVLHFMPADRAREVAAGYTAAIAPGSCAVISVGRNNDKTTPASRRPASSMAWSSSRWGWRWRRDGGAAGRTRG